MKKQLVESIVSKECGFRSQWKEIVAVFIGMIVGASAVIYFFLL